MRGHADNLWSLDELTAQVALALAVDYAGQSSGRVREVPDVRTIRYYTTLGLLDRPAAMRGRTALYNRRHLLQLVAIKRLQARGLPLAEIQQRLFGLTDAALRQLAQLPASLDSAPRSRRQSSEEAAGQDRQAFWAEPPSEPAAEGESLSSAPAESALRQILGVPLTDGATLLLDASRPLDEHDLEALRSAAAPLVKLLRARRLIGERDNTSRAKGDTPS
jgi:DNA-binding transcriptional MerR regulator